MQNKPLNLGDILEKVFIVSGKSLSRNIIVSSIIMLPTGIILAFGMNYFFNRIIEFSTGMNPHYGFGYDAYEVAKFILIYLATILGAGLLQLAGYLGTTHVFQRQYNNIKATVNEAFAVMFSSRLVELILFAIIISAAAIILFGVPIASLAFGSASEIFFLSFIGGVLLIAVILFVIFISIKWILLIPTMVIEDCGVFEALKRSSSLVKYYWWRTFGIYLLISFIVQIALSIITTPFSIIVFLDFIISVISSADSMSNNFNDPYFVLSYFSGFGYKIGLISWVAYVAQLCILPCIQVVMYFDLKARKSSSAEEVEVL